MAELIPHENLPMPGCDCGGCWGELRPEYGELAREIRRLRLQLGLRVN